MAIGESPAKQLTIPFERFSEKSIVVEPNDWCVKRLRPFRRPSHLFHQPNNRSDAQKIKNRQQNGKHQPHRQSLPFLILALAHRCRWYSRRMNRVNFEIQNIWFLIPLNFQIPFPGVYVYNSTCTQSPDSKSSITVKHRLVN